jgi:hypothetical protein
MAKGRPTLLTTEGPLLVPSEKAERAGSGARHCGLQLTSSKKLGDTTMSRTYLCMNRIRRHSMRRSVRGVLLVLLFAALVGLRPAQAKSGETATPDQQTLQALLQRIDRLEARVQQLESTQKQGSVSTSKSGAIPAKSASLDSTPANEQSISSTTAQSVQSNTPDQRQAEPTEHAENERMDLSKTLLRIRGFGDVNFLGDNRHGDTTAFSLGELDLFVTSDISDHFKFLSELVFEAENPRNTFKAEPERLLLQYSYNDYFNLAAGRYHTAIGYYNTAYHHSTWLQTATDRPFIFQFEDEGGILPIHNVGLSASGLVPSGPLGLHYVAEVGNGRASRTPLADPVQNVLDENNHKAVNLAVFSRPARIPGFQTGFSIYRDLLTPAGQAPVGETILAAHAIYSGEKFEWLNEVLDIRHTPQGLGHTFQTPSFYSQISERFGMFRPYFRYDYTNASPHEPIFADVGLRAGPAFGVRYDASDSVALKLQYDITSIRNQQRMQGAQAQVGFTF